MSLRIMTNLLRKFGPLNLHSKFNESQMKVRNSLKELRHGIGLVHGPYGSGKTFTVLSLCAELQSSRRRPKVLYLTSSNEAVNDAALKYAALCAKEKLNKNIVRLHNIPCEGAALLRTYVDKNGVDNRFYDLEEGFLESFKAAAYLYELAQEHAKKLSQGDPRRKVQNLALSEAMLKFLKDRPKEHSLDKLHAQIKIVGEGGLDGVNKAELNAQVKELLIKTLNDTDTVFTTINNASKVNLYQNLDVELIIVDESCRATELSTLIPFAFYDPVAYIFVGDSHQLMPTVLSADREKFTPPFTNPFSRQALLPLQERLARVGHPVTFLAQQYRCEGVISKWISEEFYWGLVEDATPKTPYSRATQAMLDHSVEMGLHKSYKSNFLLMEVEGSSSSKVEGTESSVNMHHVDATMTEVKELLENAEFVNNSGEPGTITILAFYKGQVSLYRKAVENLGDPRVQVRTIHGAQGHEDDVVFVDFVKSSGPGFIGQRNALTVALSRARHLCVVVSNPDILETIENPDKRRYSRHVARLLDFFRNNHWNIKREAQQAACFKCGKIGHLKADCPDPVGKMKCNHCGKFGHHKRDCPSIDCKRCRGVGHMAQQCSEPKKKKCKNCEDWGHTRKDCRQDLRVENLKCNRCGGAGHERRTCTAVINRVTWTDLYKKQKEAESAENPADSPSVHDNVAQPELTQPNEQQAVTSTLEGTTTDLVDQHSNQTWEVSVANKKKPAEQVRKVKTIPLVQKTDSQVLEHVKARTLADRRDKEIEKQVIKQSFLQETRAEAERMMMKAAEKLSVEDEKHRIMMEKHPDYEKTERHLAMEYQASLIAEQFEVTDKQLAAVTRTTLALADQNGFFDEAPSTKSASHDTIRSGRHGDM